MTETPPSPPTRLVWLDLETTGLDPRRSVILEAAIVVTDNDLNVLAEDEELVHFDPASMMIDPWCEEQHTKSGLLPKALEGGAPISVVEDSILAFLKDHVGEKASPMCGSSIHFDRAFCAIHLPRVEAYFHYRNLDVSSIKGIVERWYPTEKHAPKLEHKPHRALEDVKNSIRELRFYREHIFRPA